MQITPCFLRSVPQWHHSARFAEHHQHVADHTYLQARVDVAGHDETPLLKAWGSLMGYRQPRPDELLDACKFSMLQLPGTPYLVKSLSHDTLCQVRCTCFVEQ